MTRLASVAETRHSRTVSRAYISNLLPDTMMGAQGVMVPSCFPLKRSYTSMITGTLSDRGDNSAPSIVIFILIN